MNGEVALVIAGSVEPNLSSGYIIGAIIALFILIYLLYTLIKPEKF
jgi:K+-transporting ATPase KdpF subunit